MQIKHLLQNSGSVATSTAVETIDGKLPTYILTVSFPVIVLFQVYDTQRQLTMVEKHTRLLKMKKDVLRKFQSNTQSQCFINAVPAYSIHILWKSPMMSRTHQKPDVFIIRLVQILI